MPIRRPASAASAGPAADAAGMDTTDLAAARVRRFLETEPVIWLSTIRPDGAPHLVPTWFVWDGRVIVIRSKPGAVKVRNLRANPRAMLALGDAEADFDVGLLEATAEVVPTGPVVADLPAAFEAKYARRIQAIGLSLAEFARTYPQVIRLIPERALAWHGRTAPSALQAAGPGVTASGAPAFSEPRRGTIARLMEPLGLNLRRQGSTLGGHLAV